MVGRVVVVVGALAAGMYVAMVTVGFGAGPINHCPQAKNLVCPGMNLWSVIPSAVAAVVAMPVILTWVVAERRLFATDPPA